MTVRGIKPVERYNKRCERTGKIKWKSKADALIGALRSRSWGRAYRCEFCGTWHVTTKPFDPNRRKVVA